MRVLVTGSTSQQSNPVSHSRSANFAGLLWESLREDGCQVDWLEPSVSWSGEELDKYGKVLVGLASPLAMGANRAYGAWSVMERLWGSDKLVLFIDQPDHGAITRGTKSVLANWNSFTKPFLSYRKEWEEAQEQRTSTRLMLTALRLASRQWPTTLIPGLPWTDVARIESRLPEGASGRLRPVNMDRRLLVRFRDGLGGVERARQWAVDGKPDRKWLPSLNLGCPVRELPKNHRVETDTRAAAQLRESIGLLTGPIHRDLWWTPKIAMALSQGTPVFTDWQATEYLGPEWAALPGTVETYSDEDVADLARDQFVSYAAAIPGPSASRRALREAAGITAAGKVDE